MNTRYSNLPDVTRGIVYVRAIPVTDLPAELQAETEGLSEIYAVHSADGNRLALVANKKLAFDLARQNDLAPVSVH